LANLESEFLKEENRFEEIKQTIGSMQSEGIYPSIVGFRRPLAYILIKLTFPVLFAVILVFVNTV